MEFIVKIGYRCEFKFLCADDALKFALAAKATIVEDYPEIELVIRDAPDDEPVPKMEEVSDND